MALGLGMLRYPVAYSRSEQIAHAPVGVPGTKEILAQGIFPVPAALVHQRGQ